MFFPCSLLHQDCHTNQIFLIFLSSDFPLCLVSLTRAPLSSAVLLLRAHVIILGIPEELKVNFPILMSSAKFFFCFCCCCCCLVVIWPSADQTRVGECCRGQNYAYCSHWDIVFHAWVILIPAGLGQLCDAISPH